jgi:hypothetical protein
MSRIRLSLGVLLAVLSITGCSAHSTTILKDRLGASPVIYRISEETALTTALEAYAALYPKKRWTTLLTDAGMATTPTNGPGPGDWWHQRILVVPAIGTDTNGNEVRGYWHDYSGAARLPRPPSGQRD